MNHGVLMLGASALAGFGVLVGCNAILGIDAASPVPADAGDAGSGVVPDAAGDAGVSTSYVLSCDNYCHLMQTSCGPTFSYGNNTEYIGDDGGVCRTICSLFEPTGEALSPISEPLAADTLNCRVWHANAALLEDPHVHCPHAGPLGGNKCDPGGSDPCVPFCNLNVHVCQGNAAAYVDVADCLSSCRADAGYSGYPYRIDTVDTEISDLAPQFQADNTLNCRMYHLENAVLSGNYDVHCPHTSKSGGSVCTGGP